MKKSILHFAKATAIVGLALLPLTRSASANTVSYSSAQVIQSTYLDYNLNQFDTSLGTLTGVTVTIDFSTLQGAFTVTNNDTNAVTVSDYASLLAVKGTGLGYTQQNSMLDLVATSPNWTNTAIPAYGAQAFTIVGGQNIATSVAETITNSSFSAYEGTGTVLFQAKDAQSITTTGSSFTLDSGTAGANTQLTVTYTYSAVPEPSTYALLGLGAIALFVVSRRRAA